MHLPTRSLLHLAILYTQSLAYNIGRAVADASSTAPALAAYSSAPLVPPALNVTNPSLVGTANSSLVGNARMKKSCVIDPHWLARQFGPPPAAAVLKDDCENALFAMLEELEEYGTEDGIWIYTSRASYAQFRTARTRLALPARYTYNTCTIALSMMKAWENEGSLWRFPGIPPSYNFSPAEDDVSWIDVTNAAGFVRSVCPQGMGYATLGGNGYGVAVTLWGTGSTWDMHVRHGFGLGDAPNNGTGDSDPSGPSASVATSTGSATTIAMTPSGTSTSTAPAPPHGTQDTVQTSSAAGIVRMNLTPLGAGTGIFGIGDGETY